MRGETVFEKGVMCFLGQALPSVNVTRTFCRCPLPPARLVNNSLYAAMSPLSVRVCRSSVGAIPSRNALALRLDLPVAALKLNLTSAVRWKVISPTRVFLALILNFFKKLGKKLFNKRSKFLLLMLTDLSTKMPRSRPSLQGAGSAVQ